MLAWWLNTAWMLHCGPEAWTFARSCRNVVHTQERLLLQLLHANRDTWFGRHHRFAGITNPRMFQERVPPAVAEDFAEPIRRIAAGERNVLTSEPVRLLEPTSGTVRGEKLIPVTAGLRRQFQRGVAAWISDLFRKRPAVRAGRAYWSISPALGPPRRTPGGLPIGFDDDTAYLGRLEQFALRRLLVVPSAVTRLTSLDSFRYCTLRFLLAAEDLALISIWNPTFLLALLALLPDCWDRVCHDLRKGSLTPPTPLPADLTAALGPYLRPDPVRADRLDRTWRTTASLADRCRATWPRLALISCWTDAAAGQFLPELMQLFPGVEVQPKGLLATEGLVSFPLMGSPGAALALRCHFFEFEESAGGRYLLAHQLERAGRYRVLLTTAGGLYRYQLRDEVEVVGFHRQCPLLRFLGKSDLVSDLVGEKLAEPFVRASLARLPLLQRLTPRFLLLVPVLDRPPRYRLYVQGPSPADMDSAALARALQEALAENPYYRHAVALGQLAPVEVVLLDPAKEAAWQAYERGCLERGQKWGDIKPVVLDPWTGWAERLGGLPERGGW